MKFKLSILLTMLSSSVLAATCAFDGCDEEAVKGAKACRQHKCLMPDCPEVQQVRLRDFGGGDVRRQVFGGCVKHNDPNIEYLAAQAKAGTVFGGSWKNLDDAHYIAGPKITAASLRGRVVLVDRWAHWCGPCKIALPHTEELYQKYRDAGLMVIGAAHEMGYDAAATRKAIEDAGTTFPIYLNGELANQPPSKGIPFLYIVDASGKVCYQQTGGPGPGVEAAIKKAIAEAPNLEHDMMMEFIRASIKTRPGAARLKALDFVKRFPKEKDKMNKALKILSDPKTKKLAELEQALVDLRQKPAVSPSERKRRDETIAAMIKKAQKLDADYLVNDFEALK